MTNERIGLLLLLLFLALSLPFQSRSSTLHVISFFASVILSVVLIMCVYQLVSQTDHTKK